MRCSCEAKMQAMPLHQLQHFLIQTKSIEDTKNWYIDVLGMREGPHIDFKFPVAWLYIGDNDVLHLTEGGGSVGENRKQYLGQQSEATYGTGVVDHVAFRATGLEEMISHLEAKEIAFTKRKVSDAGLFQLFLLDPNGVKVELNFENADASNIEADLQTADLPADDP